MHTSYVGKNAQNVLLKYFWRCFCSKWHAQIILNIFLNKIFCRYQNSVYFLLRSWGLSKVFTLYFVLDYYFTHSAELLEIPILLGFLLNTQKILLICPTLLIKFHEIQFYTLKMICFYIYILNRLFQLLLVCDHQMLLNLHYMKKYYFTKHIFKTNTTVKWISLLQSQVWIIFYQ